MIKETEVFMSLIGDGLCEGKKIFEILREVGDDISSNAEKIINAFIDLDMKLTNIRENADNPEETKCNFCGVVNTNYCECCESFECDCNSDCHCDECDGPELDCDCRFTEQKNHQDDCFMFSTEWDEVNLAMRKLRVLIQDE